MDIAIRKLCKRIGYEFRDVSLLELALTHRSASSKHNERLEFLGDSILGMVAAKTLFNRFPKQPEGRLTRMRSSLVKGETLAQIARQLELGEVLKLGSGELKSGGYRRESILADALEAILGAVYLDSNIEQCETLVLSWFDSRIENLDPNYHPKDNKTQLQEFLQARRLPLPTYEVINILGKSHEQTFVVACHVELLNDPVQAEGGSRRKAEQIAAAKALEILNGG